MRLKRERERYICYCHKPIVQRWTTPSSSWRRCRRCWGRRRPRRQRSARALPERSPPSPSTSPPSPWWRGSSLPLDYGNELPNMNTVTIVLPLWWIFLWVNICWDCNVFFSYESRCILCTPFLHPCYDQACLWEHVWGNVCISWSNGGGEVISWQLDISWSIGFLPYFVASLGINQNTMLKGRRSDMPLPKTRSIMCLF